MKIGLASMAIVLSTQAFAAEPPADWAFEVMSTSGTRAMDCEESSYLRKDGITLRSVYIEPRWVRVIDFPERFVVVDSERNQIAVSGLIDDSAVMDLSDISDTIHFPAAMADDENFKGVMARTNGKNYGLFFMITNDVAVTWTCRMVKPGKRAGRV